MRGFIYTPGLKTKRGEMKALAELSATTAAKLLPLIDVLAVPDGSNGARVTQHIEKHLEQFQNAWRRGRPFYLDLFDVGTRFRGLGGIHPVTIAYRHLRSNGFDAIPVVGLDRDPAYLRAVRDEVAESPEAVCIRLLEEDLTDIDAALADVQGLLGAMAAVGLEHHAILDFRGIENANPEWIRDRVEIASARLFEVDFSRIVFMASSMPASMGGIARDSTVRVARKEFSIWRDLVGRASRVAYGDYGVIHPDFVDLDPRVIRPAAKIRYVTQRNWLVVKGRQWVADTRQHRQLAAKLMNEPEYRRLGGAWGERYLRDCARGRTSCGTLERWVAIDTNTHIDFTLRQVSRELVGVVSEEAL